MIASAAVEPAPAEPLSPELQARLMDVLEHYVEQLEQGRAPDPQQLIAQHPELAGPLRAHLANVALLHRMGAELHGSGEAAPGLPDLSQKQLGDYLLLRPVGHGGMGIVYEARQLSLGRRVALKILPFASVLDEKQIERFKNEARAAAQLCHPHIVPVYCVGCESGVHYYAMQFIDGQSLDRILLRHRQAAEPEAVRSASTAAGGSTTRDSCLPRAAAADPAPAIELGGAADYPRRIAELGIQVAEALHYAHEHGIIHRDVKPSNLLLDGQGKVWITDFGLVRFQADAGLTTSGDLVGTLRYMSPEQAAGKSALIDERIDVYALGITLYELLTFRDAFEGADRQEVLRRIVHEEPPAPRRVRPEIPRDLETIVLKAAAKAREQRYATARELAEDLRRFLAGQPILARRPSLVDRVRKWALRHRRAMRFALALAAVAVLSLVISTLLIARAHLQVRAANADLAAALQEAQANRLLAEEHLGRAQAQFRRAREVVDVFGTRYGERLAKVPGAEKLRQEVLLDTLDYYHAFIQDAGDDPTFQRDLAVAYSKVGSISSLVGDRREGLSAYRKAEELLEKLAAAQPEAEKPRADLALCANNIGLALGSAGKTAEARDAYRRAIDLQQRLIHDHPEKKQYRRDLALSWNNFGLLESQTNAPDAADRFYREALRIQQDLLQAEPDNTLYLGDLALSYSNLSCLHGRTDPRAAVRWCREALALQTRLSQMHPGVAAYQSDLALMHSNLGTLENHLHERSESEASYLQAIGIQEQLVRRSPSVNEYRQNLAISHNNLGQAYAEAQQWSRAKESFQQSLTILDGLVREYPDELNYRSSLGGVLNNLAMTLQKLGRPEEALVALRQAIEHQRVALQAAPQVARFREFLSKQYRNYGRALRELGRAEEAADAALARKRLWPGNPQRLFSVACELALAAQRLDEPHATLGPQPAQTRQRLTDAALATLEEAVEAGFGAVEEIRESPDLELLREHPRFRALINRLAQGGDSPRSVAAVRDEPGRGP